MRKTAFLMTVFLIGVLLLQRDTPLPPGAANVGAETMRAESLSVSVPGVPLGVKVPFLVNFSSPEQILAAVITDPGIYNVNATFEVLSASPGGLNFYIDQDESWGQFVAALGDFVNVSNSISSNGWSGVTTGYKDTLYTEIVAAGTGALRIRFTLPSPLSVDQVAGNLTVSQLRAFATALPAQPLGQNTTLQWTQDATWQIAKFTLPSAGLYNITAYSGLDWTTTAGWPGAVVSPFDRLEFIDAIKGETEPYYTWNPWFDIPIGAGTGSAIWSMGGFSLEVLTAGDYYLLGLTDTFEYLNGTAINSTLYVAQVSTTTLAADTTLQLHFTANNDEAFVALPLSLGAYFDLSFENPQGTNWTILSYDAWASGGAGPTLARYENSTMFWTDDDRVERGFVEAMPVGSYPPTVSLRGGSYWEMWVFDYTYGVYVNGSHVASLPPGSMGPLTSRFDTFFLHVLAESTDPMHTATFNVTLRLQSTLFPVLTTSDLTFTFNVTTGVYYHGFRMPEQSGIIYTISANATKYTTSGEIMLVLLPVPNWYKDWQWQGSFFAPLSEADPPGPSRTMSYNASGPATLHYVAVRDGTNYFAIAGPGSGAVGGDMTEAKVHLTTMSPASYTLGTTVDTTLYDYDFTSFSFDVRAGYSYQIRLSLDYDGTMAIGYFINSLGYTPFVVESILQLLIFVDQGDMGFGNSYSAAFAARDTGSVTFIVQASCTIHFTIDVVDQTPPEVQFTGPDNGVVLQPATVTVNFSATDDFGIASLTLSIDGTSHILSTSATSYAWSATTNGLHTLVLTATDNYGNTASASIAVLIAPDPDSYEGGHAAGLALGLLYTAIGATAAVIIGLLLGYFIKGKRSASK